MEKLKEYSIKNNSAIACRINRETGEALIYVSPDAESTEVSKSLMIAMMEIVKIKDGE